MTTLVCILEHAVIMNLILITLLDINVLIFLIQFQLSIPDYHITCTNVVPCNPCYAAIVSGGKGTAQDKIKALKEAGVTVVESPAKIGSAMFEIFKQRGMVE